MMGPAISFPVILFLMQGNASSALDSATMQRIFAGVMAEFQGNSATEIPLLAGARPRFGQDSIFFSLITKEFFFFFKAAMNK